MLGEVIINDQGMLPVEHKFFCHGAACIGGQVDHRGGIFSAGRDHGGIVHRAVFLESLHNLGDSGHFLTDTNVNAIDALSFLVQDGIDSNGGFARLTVANDQLSLALAQRDDRIDGFDPCLEGGINGRAVDKTGGWEFNRAVMVHFNGAFAINRLTQGVDDPPQEFFANRDIHNTSGLIDDITSLDAIAGTQDDHADIELMKVHCQAESAIGENEKFVFQNVFKPGD